MRQRILAVALAAVLLGASCGGGSNATNPNTEPATLTVWTVFDAPAVYSQVIEAYQHLHPNVQISVVTKNYATYELEVANAIAAGNGPDIWMIRNDWLPKHVDKLSSMPDGLLGKTNLDVIKSRYPDVVAAEAASGGQVYGIPLSVDTLALYYNKDHFREARLTSPPSTWNEFVDDVQKLTQFSDTARTKIKRAGAAIGTAKNVNRAVDVLELLMLQNHTPMVNQEHTASLMNGAIERTGGGQTYPGTSALAFYTGFADPKKAAYTWNNDLPNSVDAFAAGQVSMIFSYSYMARTLLQKNPTLTYGVAPMPQVDNTPTPVDFPTYWLAVVSRTSQTSAAAWQFIQYLSEDGDRLYQAAAGNPPAKRQAQTPNPSERVLNTDPGSPWTFQSATAGTWYRGQNPGRIEQIFADMIENVVSFNQPPQVAIDNAASLVTKALQGGS